MLQKIKSNKQRVNALPEFDYMTLPNSGKGLTAEQLALKRTLINVKEVIYEEHQKENMMLSKKSPPPSRPRTQNNSYSMPPLKNVDGKSNYKASATNSLEQSPDPKYSTFYAK